MKREPKSREGSFLPHPLPALLLAPLFSRSLILVPRSFLLNRTETLATQAIVLPYSFPAEKSSKFLCDHVCNSHDHSVLQSIDITERN